MNTKKYLQISRDPFTSRAFFPVSGENGLEQPEGTERLRMDKDGEPARFIALNTEFPDVEARVMRFLETIRKPKLRFTLVGLGDVGGQVLTALKLLGDEIKEIGVFDPNAELCRRYELELNQILERPEPRIVVRKEDELFDCDVFLFTASRGVPPVGAVGDMRMVQLEKNRDMLKSYSLQARSRGFSGLFCQISDPVDQLARCVFLQTNRDEKGNYDFTGLLPEQIAGFGLGVMKARADFMARRLGADCEELRAYGPHGAELIIANDPVDYDPALSAELTMLTVGANMEVRALGFKPYIAPAISSAALSILRLLRGETFLGAVPMNGVYFGCRSRLTPLGFETVSENIHPALCERIDGAWKKLREGEELCGA